jgi:hypothetical protein
VSFILDALKKLEREKDAREPGVVVVGPVRWGGQDRRRRASGLALAGVVVILALGVAFLWLRSKPGPPDVGDVDGGAAVPSAEMPAGSPVATPPRETEGIPPLAPNDVGTRSGEAGLDAPPPRETTPPSMAGAPGVIFDDGEGTPAENAAPEPTTTPPPEPEYRLTAISSRDGRPIALLNDRLVREGDSFDGITVVAIGETSIEIEVDGQRRTIGF